MKNKQLIINAALGLAVVVLYILHFTSKNEPVVGVPTPMATEEVVVEEEIVLEEEETLELDSAALEEIIEESALGFPVGYVNMAKLQEEFKYFDKKARKMMSDFEAKRNNLQKELQDFEKRYQQLVADVQNGILTEEEAAGYQAELQPLYMRLQEKSSQMDAEFQKKQAELLQDANDKISKFLAKNSDRLKYSMVIGNSELGAVVLYAKDDLEITDQMIKGLNKAYK